MAGVERGIGAMRYRGIGYWRSPKFDWSAEEQNFKQVGWSGPWLADPVRLLQSTGGVELDPNVISYLRRGREFARWRGYSFCRFECGIPDPEMGHRCLTDGAWVWPEGLVHYVERHRLPLPEEFVEVARARSGEVPDVAPAGSSLEREEPDHTFFNGWYVARTS